MWFNTRRGDATDPSAHWLSMISVSMQQCRHASCDIDSLSILLPFPCIISPSVVLAANGDYDAHHCEKWVINITMVLKHSPSAIGKRLKTGSEPALSAGLVSFIVIYLSAHLIWCCSAFRPALFNADESAMKVIDKLNVLTGTFVDVFWWLG